jgi:hypothetical protein
LLLALQDTLLLPIAPLAYTLSPAVLSFPVFLFRDYLVPLTVRYCLLLCFCCLVYLAGGSSAAGCSSIAVVYSYVSPVYVALDF